MSSFGGSPFVRNARIWARQFWRYEGRFGLVTSGIPLFAMCYFMMYVGVVVMDKQAEHRYLRVQSVTRRELSLQEEHDAIADLLRKADKMMRTQRIAALLSKGDCVEAAKAICALPKEAGFGESEWHQLVDSVLRSCPPQHVYPPVLITAAALGFGLTKIQSKEISEKLVNNFGAMSPFDRIVCIIGASQIGLRSVQIIAFVDEFFISQNAEIPAKLRIPFCLALANLGLPRINLLTQWEMGEDLHEIANAMLAIVTSRSFPIATIERILVKLEEEDFTSEKSSDLISLAHSLSCMEVFPKCFRSILLAISLAPIPPVLMPHMKQVILSVFLDPKAALVAEAVAPAVWDRLDLKMDWSLPEPQRNVDGAIVADILSIMETDGTQKPVFSVPPLSEWTQTVAQRVVLDRFYCSDVPNEVVTLKTHRPVFVHIDDETYPDLEEGPIDAYLQMKHMHVAKAGAKLVWVRAEIWPELELEEKKKFINSILQS